MRPSDLTYRRLAAAVIRRAALDAKSADAGRAIEARAWLAAEALDLLDALDVDAGRVRRWVDGLPAVAQLALW